MVSGQGSVFRTREGSAPNRSRTTYLLRILVIREGAGLVEKKQLQRRAGLKRPMQPRVSQGRCRLRRLRRRQTAKSGSSVAVGRECNSHPAAMRMIILRVLLFSIYNYGLWPCLCSYFLESTNMDFRVYSTGHAPGLARRGGDDQPTDDYEQIH